MVERYSADFDDNFVCVWLADRDAVQDGVMKRWFDMRITFSKYESLRFRRQIHCNRQDRYKEVASQLTNR